MLKKFCTYNILTLLNSLCWSFKFFIVFIFFELGKDDRLSIVETPLLPIASFNLARSIPNEFAIHFFESYEKVLRITEAHKAIAFRF